jgi:hypothetical protein
MKIINHNRLDKVVSDARKAADTRAEGYRERALKLTRGSAAVARVNSPRSICAN